MVESKLLLIDAEQQYDYLLGFRKETARLYKEVVDNLNSTSIDRDDLVTHVKFVECDEHRKADLLKMARISFNAVKNADAANDFFKKYETKDKVYKEIHVPVKA